MQKQPSPDIRARLAALEYTCRANQIPQKDGRKLTRCVEPADPWAVTIYRKDRPAWADGGMIGYGVGPTIDETILTILGSVRARRAAGGLMEAMADLEVELNVLTIVMATGDVPF